MSLPGELGKERRGVEDALTEKKVLKTKSVSRGTDRTFSEEGSPRKYSLIRCAPFTPRNNRESPPGEEHVNIHLQKKSPAKVGKRITFLQAPRDSLPQGKASGPAFLSGGRRT